MKIENSKLKITSQRGLTLIEIILYVAIVSIIMTTLIPFAWNVIEGGAKSATEQEVFDNARYISEQIKYQIRNATGINSVGVNSISLATSNPATNPTVIALSGGNVQITQSGVGWYDTNYQFKKQITIDHTKVSGGSDLSNFPVLISVIDPNLKTAGNGGSVQNASGFDIIFVDSNNSIKLDHEIEKYVPTTGEIEMWVRIPTLSASSDTILNMYYDNSTISTSQENKTGVWDTNYKAVWHLADNAANTTVAESTLDGYTGTSIANTSTKTGSGQIASALTFNGSTDMVKRANASGLDSLGGIVTASAWVKTSNVASEPTIFSTWDGTHGYQMYIKSTGVVTLFSDGGSDLISAATVNNNAWHYVVGVWDGTTAHIYVDGTQVLTGARTFANSTKDNQIGTQCTGASSTTCSSFFTGQIDEVRVSSNVRTAGWIATEYANQNLPGNFYSFGSATGQSSGSSINLNSQNATVSALTFTNYTSADNKTKNIQFNFTIGANYSGAGFRQEFNESTTIEGDAELRSN